MAFGIETAPTAGVTRFAALTPTPGSRTLTSGAHS